MFIKPSCLNWQNIVIRLSETPVIPERVITRPPSAELRPDQKDQDSLPAYDVLDAILYAYIEEDLVRQTLLPKALILKWSKKSFV